MGMDVVDEKPRCTLFGDSTEIDSLPLICVVRVSSGQKLPSDSHRIMPPPKPRFPSSDRIEYLVCKSIMRDLCVQYLQQ